MATKKTERIAWVREYRYNRGTYDNNSDGWTTRIADARLFHRKRDAAEGKHCYLPVKVLVTVERVPVGER
jgi:hypothetical protein